MKIARSGWISASCDDTAWYLCITLSARLRYTLENSESDTNSVTMYAIGTKIESAMLMPCCAATASERVVTTVG